MKKAYWKSDSAHAQLLKAVVSPTGHVVPKNYDPKELHNGDIGLSLRVDRGTGEMTPEQRRAAQSVGPEMVEDFLGALGIETTRPLFEKGVLVEVHTLGGELLALGLVEQVTDTGLSLSTIAEQQGPATARLVTTHISFEGCRVREIPSRWTGVAALVDRTAEVGELEYTFFKLLDDATLVEMAQYWCANVGHGMEIAVIDEMIRRKLIKPNAAEKWQMPYISTEMIIDQLDLDGLKKQLHVDEANALNDSDLRRVIERIISLVPDVEARDELLSELTKPKNRNEVRRLGYEYMSPPALRSCCEYAWIKDPSWEVVQLGISRLEDQGLLTRIVEGNLRGVCFDYKEVALAKLLNDPSRHVALAKNSSVVVACAAAKLLTDQKDLAELATDHPDFRVRVIAVNKLTDQKLLAKLTKDWDKAVREAAVARVSDQKLLMRIAIAKKESWGVRTAAVRGLTDVTNIKTALKALCAKSLEQEPEDNNWLSQLLGKLISDDICCFVAEDEDLRRSARLTALDAMSSIGREERLLEHWINLPCNPDDALALMMEARALELSEVALHKLAKHSSEAVQKRAALKSNDQDLLVELLKSSPHFETRRYAAGRLQDPTLRLQLALSEPILSVAKPLLGLENYFAARPKLSEAQLLQTLIRTKNNELKELLAQYITDAALKQRVIDHAKETKNSELLKYVQL